MAKKKMLSTRVRWYSNVYTQESLVLDYRVWPTWGSIYVNLYYIGYKLVRVFAYAPLD